MTMEHVCMYVNETMHVFWTAAANVTSAPSLSLLAVTWSVQLCWTWLHKDHAVFLASTVCCVSLCVWVFCCCVFFVFLGGGHTACLVFYPHYLHSMHIAVFHLVHSSACVWDVLSSLTQINSTGALLGCDWVCTWSLWWVLYISFCESFKCCLQKGRIKHVLSTKGFTSADFEKKILLRTDLSYALNIIRWVEFRENLHLIFSVIPFDVTAVCGSIGPKLGTEIFTT